MRYIKKFTTVHKSKGFILDDTNTPNISLIEELITTTGGVRTTQKLPPHDYSNDYFTLVAEEDTQFVLMPNSGTISYSLDYGETWSDVSKLQETPIIEAGDKVLVKGNISLLPNEQSGRNFLDIDKIHHLLHYEEDLYWEDAEYSDPNESPSCDYGSGSGSGSGSGEPAEEKIIIHGKYSIEGNIMSLFYGDNFKNNSELNDGESLAYLFTCDEYLIHAKNLVLPSSKAPDNCYRGMFLGCTSLKSAPALPATDLGTRCYFFMFGGCKSLQTAPLILPATTLAESCYESMFGIFEDFTADYYKTEEYANPFKLAYDKQNIIYIIQNYNDSFNIIVDNDYSFKALTGCTSLTTAPALPATTLAKECYYFMFYKCTSLTTAPELPATTLADSCYSNMFDECTSLTTAPALPATTLTNSCYYAMFYNCTSLITAPALPATTLADSCYSLMFAYCTSLTAAPALPATTLAKECYSSMFVDCTSLTSVPALPATTLTEKCYSAMFYGCTSLTTAPALPATILAFRCYANMFNSCTSLTTAPELPATTLTNSCYADMFNGCSSLNYVKCLASSLPSGATSSFTLMDWLKGVSETGTFVKAENANLPSGSSGIPNGWTVQTVSI